MISTRLFCRESERVAGLYLVTIALFGILSLLALAVTRFEHLLPATQLMTPRFFGQLLGLHRILLRDFVLWPVVPAVLGLGLLPRQLNLRAPAFPRMAMASWLLFLFGGLAVIWSFLWGGIETGWSHAVASAAARPASSAMLVGLFCGALAALLVAVNLIATTHERPASERTIFARCLYAASWVQVLAGPIYLSSILLALLHGAGVLHIFDPSLGGDAKLLPILHAFATAPITSVIVLCSIGAVAAALRPERVLTAVQTELLSKAIVAFALLGLVAIDARAVPVAISVRLTLMGAFFKTLWLVPLFMMLVPLMEAALTLPERWNPARLYALASLLLIVVAAPLDVFLGLPAAAYFAVGYLSSAADYLLLGGGSLMALFAVLARLRGIESPSRQTLGIVAATVLTLGLATTIGPMIILGKGGLSMELGVYPDSFLIWQVLVLAGGTIFAGGLLLSAAALAGKSQAPA